MAETTSQNSTTAPVFIVGMNGSGTTMLLDCLNNHPAFYGFPLETKILPLFVEKQAEYGDLSVDENFLRLWNDLRNIVYFRIVNDRKTPPLPEDWADRERTFGAALDGVFRYFSDCDGKRRWCEKSPMYTLYMDAFADIFPDARFIHMIRDGRDCAGSFHRRWNYAPQRTMYRWKTVVARGRELGQSLGDRYMELRYEDLTDKPIENMKRICDFLDEPYTDSMLRIGRARSEQKTLADSVIPNKEKWRTYFSEREQVRLERIGGRLLAELGYETNYPDADWNPSKMLLHYWRYRDYAKRAGDTIRQFLSTNDSQRRRIMIDVLVTNIRHKLNVGIQ